MGKHAAIAGLSGAALVITSASVPTPRPPPRRAEATEVKSARERGTQERDGRRLGPTVHRAGPAELAVRNRVALLHLIRRIQTIRLLQNLPCLLGADRLQRGAPTVSY